MIEAIAVVRDITIILAGIIITAVVVVVGRAVLDLARQAEVLRVQASGLVNGVARPVRGIMLAIGRITGVR